MMMHRGHGDAGCIELQARIAPGGQQFFHRRKDGNRVPGRGVGGTGRIRLNGSHKGNTQPRRFQFAVNTEMVLAEGAVSGHGNAQNGYAGYCAAPFSGPLPSTALRQRL